MILSQGAPNTQRNSYKCVNMGTSSKEQILQEPPVTLPSRKSQNLSQNMQGLKSTKKSLKYGSIESKLINILIVMFLIVFISAQEQLKGYNNFNEQQIVMHSFKSPNNSRSSPKSNHEPYHRSQPRADPNINKNSEEHRQSYWQQQQNSSTMYHLHEQIRLLKLKNSHLQQHMDRMQLQYQQLRRTLEMFQQNEKQQLKRNNQLISRVNNQQNRILELKNQLELLKLQNQELKADGKTAKYRQEQLRRRIERIKTNQMSLNDKIQQLQKQNEQLKAKNTERQKQSGRNKNEVSSIKKQVESLQYQLAETQAKSSHQIEKIKQEFQQKQRELTTTIDNKQEQLKKIDQINRQLKLHNQNLQSQLKDMLEQIKEPSNTKQIEELLSQSGQIQMKLKAEISQKDKEAQNLKQKIQRLQQQQQQLQQKCNAQTDPTKIQDFIKVQGENKAMKQKIAEQIERNELLVVELTHYKSLVNKHKEQNKQKIMNAEEEDDLQQLQKQYNQQLQALRRLILYKKYSNPNENNVYLTSANNSQKQEKIRQEYQKRIDVLVRDYQELQKELLSIQQEAITKHYNGSHDSITFRTSEEERDLYVQAIRKWQLAYQQQQAIYEAKITSKQEHINLLNLRITNISQPDC